MSSVLSQDELVTYARAYLQATITDCEAKLAALNGRPRTGRPRKDPTNGANGVSQILGREGATVAAIRGIVAGDTALATPVEKKKRHKRRRMTPAERRAVSARMKARWAEWRAGTKKRASR